MFIVSASDEFKENIKASSRELKALVYINNIEYTGDAIVRMSLEDGINSGEIFTIGEVFSKSIDIEMLGVSGINEGAKVEPFLGIKINAEYEYVPLGLFYVSEVNSNKNLLKIKCYDQMLRLENEYVSKISFPASIADVLSDVCSQNELDFTGVLPDIIIKRDLKGYSVRQIISCLSSLIGCNARFNRLGTLEFVGFTETNSSLTGDSYITYNQGDNYKVSAITCKFGDAGNTRGDNSYNCVFFENPLVDDTNIDYIYDKLKGIEFTSGQLKYRGDFSLDAGDFITVTDTTGVKHKILISHHQITFSGGISGNIKSIGEGKTKNTFVQNKFKNKKTLTELNIKLGEVQTIVQEVETNYEDLTERVNTAEQKITAEAITSTVTSSEQYINDLGEKVTITEVKSEIKQEADKINQKIESTDGRVSELNQTLEEINLKVEEVESDIDGHESRIQSAEQKITPESITSTVTSSQTFKDRIGREILVIGSGNDNSKPVGIWVDGVNVYYSENRRGMHLVALDKNTLEVVFHNNAYDIGFDEDASEYFLGDLRNLRHNQDVIIILASYDSLTNVDGVYINHQIPVEINAVGGLFPEEGKLGYRQAYALIGHSKAGAGGGVQKFYPYTSNGEIAEAIVRVSDGRLIGTDNTQAQVHETMAEIKVQADSINQSITSTNGKVSELEHTLDGFEFKVSNKGSANLIENSLGKNGDKSWTWFNYKGQNFTHSITFQNDEWTGYEDTLRIGVIESNSDTDQGYAQKIKVVPGKKYVFRAMVGGHRSAKRVVFTNEGNDAYITNSWTSGHMNGFEEVILRFTATERFVHLRIGLDGSEGNAIIWLKEACLVEGEIPSKWQSHASEIYEGVTKINEEGVKVIHSDGYKSFLSPNSLEFLNANDKQAMAMTRGGIEFIDENYDERIGFMKNSRVNGSSINGITLGASSVGDYITLGHFDGTDYNNWSVTPMLRCIPRGSSMLNNGFEGIFFYSQARAGNGITFTSESEDYPHQIQGLTGGNLGLFGDNGVSLGCKVGNNMMSRLKFVEGDAKWHNYADWDFHNWTIWNMSTARSIYSPLARTNVVTKSLESEEQEVRFIYKDMQIREGKAIISIPNRYKYTMDSYTVVSIVKKGKGDIWISEELDQYFIIEAEQDIKFNCEITIVISEPVVARTLSNTQAETPNEQEVVADSYFVFVDENDMSTASPEE